MSENLKPPYLDREIAVALGVCTETVRRRARANEIPSLRIGRRRVYPRALIDPWLAGFRRTATETERGG